MEGRLPEHSRLEQAAYLAETMGLAAWLWYWLPGKGWLPEQG
jgi:hypothetical protein